MRGAHDTARLGERVRASEVRDAEVAEPRAAVGGEEHVFRLEVAVEDVEPMDARHGVGHVERDGDHQVQRKRMVAPEPGGEGPALHVLHDDVRFAVLLHGREDLDDIRVIELTKELRFALKALEGARL